MGGLGDAAAGVGELGGGDECAWFGVLEELAAGWFVLWWPRNFQAASPPAASTSTTATAKPIHAAVWSGRGRYGGPGWPGPAGGKPGPGGWVPGHPPVS